MEETIVEHTTVLSKYISLFIDKLPQIISSIVIILIGVLVAKVVKKILTRALYKYKSSSGLVTFLINLVQVCIILLAAMQALSSLGVNTTSFAAILGAAGFSVGLAFKEILANLGSCMIVLFFRPYQIGDYILCDAIEGTVFDIQMFATSLRTTDNKIVVMPNSLMTTNPLINFTALEKRRINFIFDVEYDTNVPTLYEIANRLFSDESRILNDPQPLIAIDSMDNNILTFVAKPWVKTDDYWDVYYKLMEEFKSEFDKNNIKLSHINMIKPS